MASRGTDYNYNYIFKFIIIGERGTGKSCLLRQFIDKKFTENLAHTIGVDFGTRIVSVEDQRIKLQIWDTAGQERFKSITRSYYRGAAGALLVYDVSKRTTFNHIATWLEDLKMSNSPNIFMVLVGNKADLTDSREVSYDEANKFAMENGLHFIEASAKSGDMVDECFLEPSRRIYEQVLSGKIDAQSQDSGVQIRVQIGGPQAAPTVNSVLQSVCRDTSFQDSPEKSALKLRSKKWYVGFSQYYTNTAPEFFKILREKFEL